MTDMLHDLAVGYRKTQVKNTKKGAIVRFEGEWGVLTHGAVLDRWIGGRLKLRSDNVVEVLEKKA